ncbi:hypothetical protein BLOT_000186 [Blomia tropicalis]|nr:hypothetical protein BLOT_000186 [Blomia tropicalis]
MGENERTNRKQYIEMGLNLELHLNNNLSSIIIGFRFLLFESKISIPKRWLCLFLYDDGTNNLSKQEIHCNYNEN